MWYKGSYGILWNITDPMEIYECYRILRDVRNPMDINDPMGYYGILWDTMGYYEILRDTMGYEGLYEIW